RPNLALRVGAWALIAVIVYIGVQALLHLNLAMRWPDVAGFLQSSQAIQNVVFLGVAVLFLANAETRIKRHRAHSALHELRSIAHIVDMHQLTKDPDQFLAGSGATGSSPRRTMTPFELSRYLDYCTELLSLLGKPLALPFRLRILLVQAGRDAGRPTMLREAAHRHLVLERVLADAQPIAHPQLLRPLRAGTIHFDLAAVDGRRRDGAGLEEARRPKPGVQANRRDVGHQRSDIRHQTSVFE